MKYAWIENNRIRDISFFDDIASAYTPEIAAHYMTQVPDNAQPGWVLINGIWTDPETLNQVKT